MHPLVGITCLMFKTKHQAGFLLICYFQQQKSEDTERVSPMLLGMHEEASNIGADLTEAADDSGGRNMVLDM